MCVFIIIVLAFFLRVYRLPETLMFLSDQGRDAVVLKRLVTLEKMVFVGPTTSIGNVFTGPAYYYIVAPFMLIWGLNPVGPAYGVAIINTLGLLFCFYCVNKYFGSKLSLIFLLLGAFSANHILQSRFSWNPNPLPIFAFATILAFYIANKNKGKLWYVITGLLFGISLQLHYIAIIIPFFSLGLLKINVRSKPDIVYIKRSLVSLLIVAIVTISTFTPLILFELKNGFVNTNTLLRASETGEVEAKNTTYAERLADTSKHYILHTFSINIFDGYIANRILILSLLSIFIATFYFKDDSSSFVRGAIILIGTNILILSRLETGRHVHYYNPSYFASFFILSYLFAKAFYIFRQKLWKTIVVVIWVVLISIYVQNQVSSLKFIFATKSTDTQLDHAKRIAEYVIANISSSQYQIVGLPYYETEGHIRYYLEWLGKRPMSADTLGDPKELFIVCHTTELKDCDIPGNAQWQIADFQNRHPDWQFDKKVTKNIDNLVIYKIVY